jgi:hypothetical protein
MTWRKDQTEKLLEHGMNAPASENSDFTEFADFNG